MFTDSTLTIRNCGLAGENSGGNTEFEMNKGLK